MAGSQPRCAKRACASRALFEGRAWAGLQPIPGLLGAQQGTHCECGHKSFSHVLDSAWVAPEGGAPWTLDPMCRTPSPGHRWKSSAKALHLVVGAQGLFILCQPTHKAYSWEACMVGLPDLAGRVQTEQPSFTRCSLFTCWTFAPCLSLTSCVPLTMALALGGPVSPSAKRE